MVRKLVYGGAVRRLISALFAALFTCAAAAGCGGSKVVEPAPLDLSDPAVPPSSNPGSTLPGASRAPGTSAPTQARSDGVVTFLDIVAPVPPSVAGFSGKAIEFEGTIVATGVDDAASEGRPEPGAVWLSRDGGKTFTRAGRSIAVPGGQQAINDIVVVGRRLVAVGSDQSTDRTGESTAGDAAIWVSDDRGVNWRSVALDQLANRPGLQALTQAATIGTRVIAVGLTTDSSLAAASADAIALLSDDGGLTWRERAIDRSRGAQQPLALASIGNRIVVVGSDAPGNAQRAAAWLSDDDGETWVKVAIGTTDSTAANEVVVAGERLVAVNLAAGATPAVWTSADRGATWQLQRVQGQVGAATSGTALVAGSRIYVAGERLTNGEPAGGVVWYSDDFGASWQAIGAQLMAANAFTRIGGFVRTSSGELLVFGRFAVEDPAKQLAVASISAK